MQIRVMYHRKKKIELNEKLPLADVPRGKVDGLSPTRLSNLAGRRRELKEKLPRLKLYYVMHVVLWEIDVPI